jgi:predicted dienelactone hydrolase
MPTPLDYLLQRADHFAGFTMRQFGRVPPARMAQCSRGTPFYLPAKMGDERAKDSFANTAMLLPSGCRRHFFRKPAMRILTIALGLQVMACGLCLAVWAGEVGAATYDPLAVAKDFKTASLDLTVHDVKRDRDIPLRVYLPASSKPAPVVLFSHGLGGTRNGSRFLGEHWAARGYLAVFLQHPGSDDSVWRNKPLTERMAGMNSAASLDNFLLRVQDVAVVLNQLEAWNAAPVSALAGRMDLKQVGMSGHSFGAVTTQAVSGQRFAAGGQRFADPRVKAAIAFSPSTPRGGRAEEAFGAVRIPWLLMTGTKDIAPIGGADIESRLGVYPALRGAPKYEVVLHNAEHSAFTDRALPGDRQPRNPNHHRVILALSTAFWDACLRGEADALAWLRGSGPRSVMEASDRWQFSAR